MCLIRGEGEMLISGKPSWHIVMGRRKGKGWNQGPTPVIPPPLLLSPPPLPPWRPHNFLGITRDVSVLSYDDEEEGRFGALPSMCPMVGP